jgi:hypothetical protein
MSTETSDGVTTSSGLPGAGAPVGSSAVSSPPVAPSRRALLPRIFSRAQLWTG